MSSGRGLVVGVNKNDQIFFRIGITPQAPYGTQWAMVGGKLSMIDIYKMMVVGANSAMTPWKSPVGPVRGRIMGGSSTKTTTKTGNYSVNCSDVVFQLGFYVTTFNSFSYLYPSQRS